MANRIVSPVTAVLTASVALAMLVGAVTWRSCRSSEAAGIESTPPGDAGVSLLATPASPDAPALDWVAPPARTTVTPLPSLEPPTLTAVKARVAVAEHGVTMALELALHVTHPGAPHDLLEIRARCAVDGEWYDGFAALLLDRIDSGDQIVTRELVVGRKYRLGVLPTACHLQFSYLTQPMKRRADRVFAVRCWNGTGVIDGPCPPLVRTVDGKPILDLQNLSVSTNEGVISYLRVSVDAELHRPLEGWTTSIAADCTMPGGATRSDRATIPLGFLTVGKPFSDHATLFFDQHLTQVPVSCTLRVELEDADRLAHEPVGVRCWKAGVITSGACTR